MAHRAHSCFALQVMKEEESFPTGGSASTPVRSQTNQPKRILVVEYDEEMRRLNTDMLSRSGYEVDAVEDGAVAWDALELSTYDLVVTDNSMPKMTGVELLKELRAARMSLPVIMATRTLPLEEFSRQPWLQPAATLVKPYTSEELLAAVKEVLGAVEPPRLENTPPPNRQGEPQADDSKA